MIVTDIGEDDHPPALPSTRTLERFVVKAAAAIPLAGDLSVLLTGDRGIRRLNREYRKKNKPTDVLSFPAAESGSRKQNRIAGDLAISIDTAARQAIALDHSLATELKVLLLHGMLHLAGFDHEIDEGEMATRELELRRKLRLPGGLIERTEKVGKAQVSKARPRLRAGSASLASVRTDARDQRKRKREARPPGRPVRRVGKT
jgi:probable rRNA maturation factor